MQRPESGLPPDWSTLADGLRQPGGLVVARRNRGAVTGTGLGNVLRRRSSASAELHAMTLEHVLPRISRVVGSADPDFGTA